MHKKDIVSNDVLCTSLNKSLENLKLCNVQFQNRHSKKLLQVVRTLQRDIFEICDDYKCLETKHLIHIHRFIENFSFILFNCIPALTERRKTNFTNNYLS